MKWLVGLICAALLVAGCGSVHSSGSRAARSMPTSSAAPAPVDTNDPAADDSAIEAQINAACTLPGYQGGSPSNTDVGCQDAALAGLNQARAQEGLPPDSLPVGFWGAVLLPATAVAD
jgi:hypothetical protein